MRFVAIDFETANHRADSACQLAAVKVLDGEMVEQRCWLLKPPRMYFSPRNIAVHGIRAKDVENAPTIEQIWHELWPMLDGEITVAHNARFDLGVLVHSLSAFETACPDMEFQCTRLLARAAWPGRPRYGLKPLGDWLGVQFKHHDALEDARCCARIALAVLEASECTDLPALEQRFRLRRGHYRQGQLTSPRMIGRRRATGQVAEGGGPYSTDRWGFPVQRSGKAAAVNPAQVIEAAGQERPFAGRKLCFLGPLRGMTMESTLELAGRLGAECHASIKPDTDYVIACGTSLEEANSALEKQKNAPDIVPAKPQRFVRVLSERQFLALLPGGKASTRW